jgi:DNA topoisomerase-6 subunit A
LPKAKAGQSPVVGRIVGTASEMHGKIVTGKKPAMKFPLRNLSNVRYTAKKGYFEMKGRNKERTLTVSTVKTFAQTLRMLSLSKNLIESDDFATKRDAYYQTKNWDEARCDEQVESDTIMDDIEAFYGLNKEQLGFRPDDHGGLVAGELTVLDRDRGTNKTREIDCTTFGSGAYGSTTIASGRRPTASWSRWPACRRARSAASSGASPTRRRSRCTSSSTAIRTGSATSTAR